MCAIQVEVIHTDSKQLDALPCKILIGKGTRLCSRLGVEEVRAKTYSGGRQRATFEAVREQSISIIQEWQKEHIFGERQDCGLRSVGSAVRFKWQFKWQLWGWLAGLDCDKVINGRGG